MHHVAAEASILYKTHVCLPCRDGAGTAADGLEIVVGDAAYGRDGREHRSAHTVAARHILGTALGIESGRLEKHVTQTYGIEIVTAALTRYELHARSKRFVKPHGREVVGRHRQQQPYVVLRAYLGKCTGRISGRSHYQYAVFIRIGTSAHAVRLGLLERAGSHRGTALGIVSVERDVEAVEPQMARQTLTAIGDGSSRALQHAVDGKPVAEFVESVAVVLDPELFLCVDGSYERGFGAGLVFERPTRIVEFVARSHTLERISGRCEVLHYGICSMNYLRSANLTISG